MDVYVGILLMNTMKKWGTCIACPCDAPNRYSCKHSVQDGILKEQLPQLTPDKRRLLLKFLHDITEQTCDCENHYHSVLHGPSKMIKEPIPDYSVYQKKLMDTRPEISEAEHRYIYQKAIVSWMNARLFLYITPYSMFDILQEVRPTYKGQFEPYVREFSEGDRVYLERALMQMGIATQIQQDRKLEQLAKLKKTYCLSGLHLAQRIDNFLKALHLDDYDTNLRKMALKMFNIFETKIYVLMGSCHQKGGTCMTCQEVLYEVTQNKQGGFDATHIVGRALHQLQFMANGLSLPHDVSNQQR